VDTRKTTDLILDRIDPAKRQFVKGLLVGSAFVVPMVATFSMDKMRVGVAMAANGTSSGPTTPGSPPVQSGLF
jgi:hypothetical protein